MPKTYTKKRKTYRKRRSNYRRKPRGPRGAPMTKREKLFLKNPGSIVPDNYFAKLNANDNAAIGVTGETPPSTGFPNIHAYLGNGTQNVDLWRTNLSSGNLIDANGHDQMVQLYATERIHGSEINVNFLNIGNDIYRCVVFPLNITILQNGQTTYSMNDMIEQPYAKHGTLTGSSAVAKLIIRNYMSTKRMFGYKDISLNDDFSCATQIQPGNVAPTNQWVWVVAVQSMTGASAPDQNVITEVKITYFSEFYNRNILANANDIGPTGI